MRLPPYRDITVGDLSALLAAVLPNRDALIHRERRVRLTFAALEQEVRTIARGLMALGVARGERVALWATNVPEWVVLQFALAKIGAVLVTVNTSLRAHELEYLLRQSEAATFITIRRFKGLDYLAILAELDRPSTLQRTILLGARRAGDAVDLLEYNAVRELAVAVSDAQLDRRAGGVAIDDIINMQYTSGTTGFPKGVMLSSRNIVNNAYWLTEGLGFTPDDKVCLCVPLFHCFGVRHRRARCLHARRRVGDGRGLRRAQGARNRSGRALHGAVRCANDVPRRVGTPNLLDVRPAIAQDRRHGRRALSGTVDEARHR